MSLKDQQNEAVDSARKSLDKKLASEHRLCHMVKRSDFDGYGFNLHSEKGKPGQYIGKVDEKSPAESSGLRQGDRIIEVNGVNIGHETHKQVVQRIKAIENEVRLLVIDPEIETKIKQEHDKEQETATTTTTTTTTNNNASINTSPTGSMKNTNNVKEHQDQHARGAASGGGGAATATVNNNNNNNSSNNNNSRNSISTVSSIDSSSNGGQETTATLTATPSPSPPLKSTIASDDSVQNGTGGTSSNGMARSIAATSSSTSSSSTATATSATGLNLRMTAAEMRAKLQARKKYDPKNDSVDLRKKFDIIQKL